MSVRYSEAFKKEVVKAYMAGDKSIHQLAVASLNSDYINTDLAINTLKIALKKENYPKVILHSDQGVQFTSWDFVNFCKDNNVTQSMSKAGCPYYNAPMEARYR